MRIVVTGASGNVGTGVLRALARHMPDAQVVGVCRRPPEDGIDYERVSWHAVDLASPTASADLAPAMQGADVVVHLALAVQPVRDEDYLYRANVTGSQAVLDAIDAAGVKQLVYASSLGIYAPGAGEPVTEEWPDTGQETSIYSRHKVAVERMLDRFAEQHPDVSIARFRPTVVVQRQASWLIKTLYLGPLVPKAALEMLRRRQLPILPLPAGLGLQFVHADDVGDAVVRMIELRAQGSYNVAADVLDADGLASLVGARPIAVSPRAARSVVSALSAARIIALTPGWYDVATNTPLMDTSKAHLELGWSPAHSSTVSARELIEGLADEAIGSSAATGFGSSTPDIGRAVARVHDASLLTWTGLALARAVGKRRAGVPDAIVVATNLASGTPLALDRILERRTDKVALVAPVAVLAALAATVRGGWAPVAATAALHVLNGLERKRRAKDLDSQPVSSLPGPGSSDR
ncbi:NAD-dependent epimerase/dehydratase family protein [Mycolicibacterium sp. GCM10028919]|uniref:NAD-dependent epimerase/dehydratase family protein n=1 Tax=Mycolicibacterium sp. GCM10028919 TaxID=3273401 RepID=UPI00361294BC